MHTIHIEYELTPSRCSSYKVFGYVLNKCPKKLVSDPTKNMKVPRQAIRGVQIRSKTKFAHLPKTAQETEGN